MNADALLTNLRVASPCPARWADMAGDGRARFCAQCQKHVYNLSEMTAEDASDLIREKEGKLCVRFFQRADGTVLTADCPVGTAAVWRRARRLVAAAVALLCSCVAVNVWASNSGPRNERRPRPKAYQAWENAVSAVRELVNPKPPPALMGDICWPPPTNSPPKAPNPPPARKNLPSKIANLRPSPYSSL